MDRKDWLQQQRREAEENYSNLWAPEYGEKWGVYDNASHQVFIRKFLNLLPGPGALLDAACGAGRYLSMLLERGHRVVGIDQAQGMLDQAAAQFPTVRLVKTGLQEMAFQEEFDGAICMDAMEHVCPEDWLPIFHNFYRALKPVGVFYFTVEIADEQEVEQAYREGKQSGLPVVKGEWINDGVYHYYPPMSQVRSWLGEANLKVVEEGEGDGYHHFLTRKA